MIGFTPGFPYLGGVDRAIAAPRLETPRTHVPAGSVGIAGQQTGIYPVESPGGWRIIGRTPLTLFDAHREPPTLLAAGDRVCFVPISEAEFDDTFRGH
jgi:KipI family sensor histidine kinase inhibitor